MALSSDNIPSFSKIIFPGTPKFKPSAKRTKLDYPSGFAPFLSTILFDDYDSRVLGNFKIVFLCSPRRGSRLYFCTPRGIPFLRNSLQGVIREAFSGWSSRYLVSRSSQYDQIRLLTA